MFIRTAWPGSMCLVPLIGCCDSALRGTGSRTWFAMFKAFYLSYWQHPILLWVAPVLFLLVLRRQRQGGDPSFRRYLWVFTMLTILDPLFTGPVVSYFDAPSGIAQAVGVVFVVLGDLRYLALAELYTGSDSSGAWRRAIALSLCVPIVQGVLVQVFPGAFADARLTYLVYEVLFLVLAAYFFFVRIPACAKHQENKTWLRSLSGYVMAYYSLWALADVLILSGLDAGYALRVIPNLLYYGIFLPFAFFRAPEAIKGAAPESQAKDDFLTEAHS